ncbi:TLD-domain-containing protein [Hymenopellis radicata]|nr:TLD-domain-containing protein [Hymenopellis radicata]
MPAFDSIPPLIPLPAPQPTRAQKKALADEELLDKYAILFSPPTPRASPMPELSLQTSIPPGPDPIPSSSSDGEFGSFVSVPASEDPLAAFTPIEEDFSSNSSHHARSTSQDFFDKFAQEARLASDKNKQGVLDELLLSDRDPLYWPEPPQAQPKEPDVELDFDFFLSKSPPKSTSSMPSTLHLLRHPHSPPSRSPTLSSATLAPPIASASIMPPHRGLEREHTPPPRSQSYQTLSNISARWLPQKQIPPTRTDTLQSIFNPPPEPPISHGTPFSSHEGSYVPPTGAPGYKGENHHWDKGYSEELEHERARPATPVNMSAVIQKKTGYIDLKGRREGTVGVLDSDLANLLRPSLPALQRLPRTWTLLYSLDQHGISLNTLYARCDLPKPTAQLLIIQDTNDALFGVYMGEGIRPSKGRGYYGSGESFMFKCPRDQSDLKVFKWTGKNDYIALCEPGFLSFGGGEGQYGLYMDSGLIDGSSARCPTFGNEPLCSSGSVKGGAVAFECVGLEVWKVGS